MVCRRRRDSLFGTPPKSIAGYQSRPKLFLYKSWTCEGTLKMASATDGLQYVKWAAPNFFSVEVAKLPAPKKVLNQKGLFDFTSVER
jgi:hypothetical protein